MKKTVLVNGRERQVEYAADGRFRIDGREGKAETAALGGGAYSVIVGGTQHTVYLERSENGRRRAHTRDGSFAIEILDPRRLARGAAGPAAGGTQIVTAPMPGTVVEVKAARGDAVCAGGGVVVVEAMKMQNELKAAKDGVVTAVHVSAGDSVAAGSALVTIDQSPTMGQAEETRGGRQS